MTIEKMKDYIVSESIELLNKNNLRVVGDDIISNDDDNAALKGNIFILLQNVLNRYFDTIDYEGWKVYKDLQKVYPEGWTISPLVYPAKENVDIDFGITEARYQIESSFGFQSYPTIVGYVTLTYSEGEIPVNNSGLDVTLGWAFFKDVKERLQGDRTTGNSTPETKVILH